MAAAALEPREIDLGGGRTAVAVDAPPDVAGADAAAALGIPRPRALVVLNGGPAELAPGLRAALRQSLGDGVARVAVDERLTVVTGGTDAGIFALFGEALGDGRPAACVGVAPEGLVSPDGVRLEPHHTHFLLVRGDEWGVETDAMLELTAALGRDCPSIVVVAGGGEGARREVLAHVRAGREVAVLAGSGRLADELATDRTTLDLPLTFAPPDQAARSLAALLRARLGLDTETR